MQKRRIDGSSGLVTIPRIYLDKDDVPEDRDGPDEQQVDVDRLGKHRYLVRVSEDGTLPEPQECEVMGRLVGQRLLNEDAYGRRERAD